MKDNLPDKNFFIGKFVPGRAEFVIQEHIGSGNNAHVFRAYNDTLKHSLACKVIPYTNLRRDPRVSNEWVVEAQKANILNSPSVVRCEHHDHWVDTNANIECVVLCFHFVQGKSLRGYIKDNKNQIQIGFIKGFLTTIFELLYELQGRGMQHSDLHDGNILVESNVEFRLRPRPTVRVTDFGVSLAASGVIPRDDFDLLAETLRALLQNVNYQELSPQERYEFNILNNDYLAKHLMERNRTLDEYARNPELLLLKLEGMESEFRVRQASLTEEKLNTPFDYLSCEQLGNAHSLLKALYSNQFLGLSSIEGRNNLVLTGPRGCGKSTVYKSLSVQHRILVNEDAPANLDYLGIYYNCNNDLIYSFPRYRIPDRDKALNLPIHFVTCSLLSEVLSAIKSWSAKYHAREFDEVEGGVADRLLDILDVTPPQEPFSRSFTSIVSRLNRERKRASEKQKFIHDMKQPIGEYWGPEILKKACEVILESLSFLTNKPIVFFIDDYSTPKVSSDLQKNLNRLFMQRTASCFFKISTDSPVSYLAEDLDGKVYVESREYALLDLGNEYLHGDSRKKLAFIEDVFRRRFQASIDFPASEIDELLGRNPKVNQNENARAIRLRKRVSLWGKEVLADLCSGDIHYLINLARHMVESSGGIDELRKKGKSPLTDSETQNRSIRTMAGNFISHLATLENGPYLVEVVSAFGSVAHSYLMHKESQNQTGKPPHQATRIEPYNDLVLSAQAQNIYDELLRYSVFIEDRRGKSRRGNVVRRLWLRRALIPHFNLTFNKRDSIQLENDEMEELLASPKSFEAKFRLKKNLPGGESPLQETLFDK